LQYQINPHFLYNTYFILCSLLQEDEVEQATMLADTTGRFLRYITNSTKEQATLREEIEHAQVYAQIQQMRYSNRVQLSFGRCPEWFMDLAVPRLILQPLIENAFEHGMKQCVGRGAIRIGFEGESDRVIISVEDSGEGLTDELLVHLKEILSSDQYSPNESIALYNIHRRLHLTYGHGSGLHISRSGLGGLCCSLILYRKE
jgi:two-component system sensor histidine kinase YesM